MRLGLSNFLNCKPYYTAAANSDALFATPMQLRDALLARRLDAALISAAAFLDTKLYVHPFGIGALEKTMSVLLFLKNPNDSHLHIAVTNASQTAVALLRIILGHFWKRSFTLFISDKPSQEVCSGYLLIGDEALFHETPFRSYDLATIWKAETNLPFVFALFASYEPLPELSRRLDAAVSHFFQNIDNEPHKGYFNCLTYRLDSNHFKGLELFNALRQKLS